MASETAVEERKIAAIVDALRRRDRLSFARAGDLPFPDSDVAMHQFDKLSVKLNISNTNYRVIRSQYARDGSQLIRVEFLDPSNVFLLIMSELHEGKRLIRVLNLAENYRFETVPSSTDLVGTTAITTVPRSISVVRMESARQERQDVLTEHEIEHIRDVVQALADKDQLRLAEITAGEVLPQSNIWTSVANIEDDISPLTKTQEKERIVRKMDEGLYLICQPLFTGRNGMRRINFVLEFQLEITSQGRHLLVEDIH